MRSKRFGTLVGCTCLAALACSAVAQPRIVLLGSGLAAGVKSDGSAVAGSFNAGPLLTIGSSVTASDLPGFGVAASTPDFAYFAGSTAAGPARWTSSTASAQTFVSPGSIAGSKSVNAISADGRYVCGWGYATGSGGDFKAWVWDAAAAGGAGAMIALPSIANAQAKAVGASGVVAGVDGCCGSANRPVVWTYDAGSAAWVESYLPFDGGSSPVSGGDIFTMNDAGTVIVGSIGLSSGSINMARWTWDAGTQSWNRITIPITSMVRPAWLDAAYNPSQFHATGVTSDGSEIVGFTVYTYFSSFIRGGFVWHAATGQAIDLYDTLFALNTPGIAAHGGNPPALGFPVAMTPDGQHMAFYAGPQTGFGPPVLVSLAGGLCVAPSAAAVSSTTSTPAGSNAYLNCSVTGSEPLSIQWRFNSQPITDGASGTGSTYYGATGQGTIGVQLVVQNPGPADTGIYDCVATNPCGTATRPPLTLTVNTGACCYTVGISPGVACSVEGSNRCSYSTAVGGLGGAYLGDATTCGPVGGATCDAVSGACCFWNGSFACVVDISAHCSLVSGGFAGVYLGNGTACGPIACDAATGACCWSLDPFSSVTCSVELSSRCTQTFAQGGLSGAYAGNQVACAAGGVCPAGVTGVGGCCFNATQTTDIACAVTVSSHCTSTYSASGLQGKYLGDGVTCSASTCRPSLFGTGASLGACCFTDPDNPGSGPLCVITYIYNCSNYPNGSNDSNSSPFNIGLGGNFYTNTCCGPSSTPPISGCSTTANCAASEGACIHAPYNATTDAICTIQVRGNRCTRQYNAGGLFGTYVAGVTSCSPAILAANAGACCYTAIGQTCLICTIQPETKCSQVNNGGLAGTFAGLGSVCSPTPGCALAVGACCVFTSCSLTCAADCTSNLGTYHGDGTSCSPGDPCTPSGVCCRGATCTTGVASGAACTASLNGDALAGATFSSTPACNIGGSTISPCCYADFNKLNGLSVQDIFDFLNDWFAGSKFAHTGGDGAAGSLTVQNIFDFLNAWFGGGC